jgi:SNF2 family DNA or RNA helicase
MPTAAAGAMEATSQPTPMSAKSSKSFAEKIEEEAGEAGSDDSEEDMPISPAKRKRRRIIQKDKAAANFRENVFEQVEELENRRRVLRQTLAHDGSFPGDKAKFIINETKKAEHGFVYVPPTIARFIKPHQIEGVRFMWDHLVAKPKKTRKGCLLAHTMGLGKTMQVITLLYAIAEASQSGDDAISGQIPDELRDNKTLILCPAGLVDNWGDELLKWTPESDASSPPLGLLGHLYKCESTQTTFQRKTAIRQWERSGGVLVMGYEMLRTFFKPNKKDLGDDSDSDASSNVQNILVETPNIVIADEAHKFKNPKSQIHASVSNFRTKSRIALTGTPLANNVTDYYNMINWISHNYLGPVKEFNQEFETPIREGLWADNEPGLRKFALKRLSVLKSTVAPLVNRMSILALKDDLPQKKEFILYLDWTPVQKNAYSTFLADVVHNPEAKDMIAGGNTMRWVFVRYLGMILAHPSIYGMKLREKPPVKGKKTRYSLADSGDEENALRIPDYIQKTLLATAPDNAKGNWIYEDSRKVVVLTHILDECRRVKDKVLVFSHHIATLDFLGAMFQRQKRNFYRLDGSTQINTRQGATKNFNNDDNAEIYLISTKAGGVGLNIQGANRVVIFDFEYVPMEEQQAIGRAYRIGQDKPVFVYWLIVGGTFEESIQNRSVFKMQLQSRVVDKKNPLPWAQRNKTLFPPPRDLDQEDLSEFSGRDAVLDVVLGSEAVRGSVRKIIATEAFEEEVKDDELNAEDIKEIDTLIAKHKYRLENPGAASAFGLHLPLTPLQIPGFQSFGYSQPVSHGYGQGQGVCESEPVLSPFKAGSKSAEVLTNIIKLPVPPHMRTNPNSMPPYPGPPPMSLPSTGTVPSHFTQSQPPRPSNAPNGPLAPNDAFGPISLTQTGNQVTGFAEARKPAEFVPLTPSTGDGQPGPSVEQASLNANPQVTGSGTTPKEQRFLNTASPIAAPGTNIAAPGTKIAPPSNGIFNSDSMSKILLGKKEQVEKLLMNAYRDYDNHHQRDIMTPTEVAADIHKAIENQSFEPIKVYEIYNVLVNHLDTSSRFQAAALYGVVNAKELASMSRKEVQALVENYNTMDELAFNELVAQGVKKTSVCDQPQPQRYGSDNDDISDTHIKSNNSN